ncbi:hypothetical protein I302_101908 [Kwoniella bestiolae CBS 10118]|uniref:Metallo-beta-lactamase n=1 Tax=Kwoniella bestiolae CBS 10118 TaxID=1296100 RepID=A0A1B9GDL2_9TREE|nr:metallo-beta-lactamase [Kwoniella bestiolae CBS 10118]OCF29098.1 metallo-beta-lactamase [Kwoniella bestiolae CBS 10118]
MSDSPLQLLFMGTGTSTGLPLTPCLTLSNPYPEAFSDMVPLLRATNESHSPLAHIKGTWNPQGEFPSNIPCPCCRSAVDPDVPEGWKNKRGNTGVLVRKQSQNGEYRNLLVDVGKTFREQAARFFPEWGVKTIDAVLLTHGHADAYFGLDDLREWCIRQGRAIPVYLNQETYEKVCEAFPYMVDKTKASGGGDVPQLIWKIIKDDDQLDIAGIDVKVLAVHHGIYFHSIPPTPVPTTQSAPSSLPPKRLEPEPLICLGFTFDNSITYISDVSSIPESTWQRMLDRHPKTNTNTEKTILPTPELTPTSTPTPSNDQLPILIIDALWPLRPHASHFSLKQALETALRLKPKYTYLIGSTHPTTHFMWEEICLSLSSPERQDGQRNHPDRVQSDWLVQKVWEKVFTERKAGEKGIAERWKMENEGGILRPAWDGLVLQIPAEKGGEVEREDLSTRGLVY